MAVPNSDTPPAHPLGRAMSRLSRQAGGHSLGPSAAMREGGPPRANRGRDGPPESWAVGGNGPKMGVPLPRCDARLESRWRYLETVRASCRRAQRCAATRKTGAYCRASAPASGCGTRGPFLYGLDVGNWPWVVVAESAGHGNSSQ